MHPPWYDDEFDELGAAYFRSQGFDTVVTKAASLPDGPARVDPQRVIDWAEHHVEDRAEAVFLAGNGFRAAAAVEELELRTGRLVLEANQALLWGILAATGTDGTSPATVTIDAHVKFRYLGDKTVPVPRRHCRWRSSCASGGLGGWRTRRVLWPGRGEWGGPG